MSNKLFVGSLPFDYTDEQLKALFMAVGPVASAKMVDDKKNGRTRGFGFVAMSQDADIPSAIEKLNGTTVGDKKIWVTEARPKKEPAGPKPRRSATGKPPFQPRDDRPPFSSSRRSGPSRFQRDFKRPSAGRSEGGHFFDSLTNRRPPRSGASRPSEGFSSGRGRPPQRSGASRPSEGFSSGRGRPPQRSTGKRRPGGFGGGFRKPRFKS